MGLLDSDAEDIKKQQGEVDKPIGTGRKANLSGLGILKGVNKNSTYLEKLRSKITPNDKSESTPPASVEHSRGTPVINNQSRGEVGAPQYADANALEGAKSVQSGATYQKIESSAQISEVGAKSLQTRGKVGAPIPTANHSTQNAKSVQSEGGALSLNISQPIDASPEVGAKSVSEYDSNVNLKDSPASARSPVIVAGEEFNKPIVGAKPVQKRKSHGDFGIGSMVLSAKSQGKVGEDSFSRIDLDNSASLPEVGSKSVQSGGEPSAEVSAIEVGPIGAKSVQSLSPESLRSSIGSETQGDSKSVQSGCEPVSNKAASEDIEVGAKQGRNDNFDQLPKAGAKVGAKHVQAEQSLSHGEPKTKLNKLKKTISNDEELVPTESCLMVSGSQRVILEYIFNACVWSKSSVTPPITKYQMVSDTGVAEQTLISSIKRLRSKRFIDKFDYKDGKSGWARYRISNIVYDELLISARSGVGRYVTPSAPESRVKAESPKAPEVASVGWFKDLDFSKVSPISYVMVNMSIRSKVESSLQKDVVQEFINRFTSWAATQKRVESVVGFFCSKLNELVRDGDSPVLQHMTEEERIAELEYARNVEKARLEMEMIQKARAEEKSRQAEKEFEDWYDRSTDEEKMAVYAPSEIAPLGSDRYKVSLMSAFMGTL